MNQPPPYNQPPWQPQGPQGPGGWGPQQPSYGQPPGGYGYGGFGPQPPRKSNAGMVIALIVGAVLLSIGALVGVGVWVAMRAEDPAATEVMASDDGKSEIKVPKSWSRQTGLNGVAVLQVGNPTQEEYLIVISESKEDMVDYPLSKYADICLGKMKAKIADFTMRGPNKLKVGDRDGLEYEVEGTVDHVKAEYLITFVDGPKSLHQVMTWTLKSKFASKRPKFANATATFHER